MAYFRKRGCKCKDKKKCNCGATWSFTVDVGRDETGKRLQRGDSGFKTKAEAVAAAAEMVANFNKGMLSIISEKETVESYMEEYLDEVLKNELEPQTYEDKKSFLKNHVAPMIGKLKMKKVTHKDMQKFSNRLTTEKNLSPGTVRIIMQLVNQTFNHATITGDIGKNVVTHVKRPKGVKKVHTVWKKHQMDLFLESTQDSWYYPAYLIGLYMGLRPGETLALKWDKVDFSKSTITVKRTITQTKDKGLHIKEAPKNDPSNRTISMPKIVSSFLKAHKLKQAPNKLNLVVPSLSLNIMDESTLARNLKRSATKLGLPILTPHELRHTHATYLLTPKEFGGRGVGIKAVSERLGHSNTTTTLNTYAHVFEGMETEISKSLDEANRKEVNL